MERHRIDHAALRETIASLGGLTSEQKADLLQLLSEQKRYGLVWEEHTEEVEEQLRTKLPVLTEDATKRIVSTDETAPNHVIIEGDNLHALTALAYTHEGRVDVIYIDPPYNTGNKDFVYNDSFVDSEDGYRHSKWLSFMHKRLKIAKRLLSDRGVIFISIDDNEQANLKLLCDEVFGEKNCMAQLIWNLGSGTSAGHFTRSHEYIHVYCSNKYSIPNFTGGEGTIDDRAIKKKSIKNAESDYTFKAGTKFEALDGLEFTGEWGDSEKTKLVSGRMYCKEGKLAEDVTLRACWTQRNQMDSFFVGKPTIDSKGQRVIEFYFRSNGKLYCRKQRDKINPPTVLSEIGSTKQGSSKIKEIFEGEEPFGFAKPLSLIHYLLSLREKHSLILDFFAGSGTTLHATMQLNAEDGGHRQCILVTNNENGICENVTYERNRRVIQGYTTPKGVEVMGLSRNNLRYYRTEFVERETTRTAQRQLMMASTELLCIKHNVYDEQRSFGHITLRPTIARYFADGKQQMLIIYRTEAIESLVAEIAQMPESTRIIVYVFSINNYAMDADFEEVSDKVTLCALPAAIYNAYLRVLPKRRMNNNDNPSASSGQAHPNNGGNEA